MEVKESWENLARLRAYNKAQEPSLEVIRKCYQKMKDSKKPQSI